MKYHNTKIKTPDGTFDSKKEYAEWKKLKLLEQAGIISNLERQKEFQLIPTISTTEGTLRRCSYFADFFYFDKTLNCWAVRDTKGFQTETYKLKKRLMLWLYPEIVFVESGKKIKTYRNTLEVKK